MTKQRMVNHVLFQLHTGKWYLAWWLQDARAKMPEFYFRLFPTQEAAEATRANLMIDPTLNFTAKKASTETA